MEIRGNRIISEEALGQDIDFISMQGQMLGIELTTKQLKDLQETGRTLKVVNEVPEKAFDISKTEDKSEDILNSLMNNINKPIVEKETYVKPIVNDIFDFDESANEETIGEYLSYLFADDWNISKVQVRRGIAIEETKLVFLANGKCKMDKRTVSGTRIEFLRTITDSIRPAVSGADNRVYDDVLVRETKTSKLVRFTCDDITFTYELKQRTMLAQEREQAMWR